MSADGLFQHAAADVSMNEVTVAAIKDSAVPRIDCSKIIVLYGPAAGTNLADEILALVQEAASMSRMGYRDSRRGTHQIGRCVGWQLR